MDQLQIEFMRELRRLKRINPCRLFPNLNPGQCMILGMMRHLEFREGHSCPRVGSLVRESKMPAPAVSRGLKLMESRGIVERRTDPEDRRNTFVELTEEGELLSKHVEDTLRDFVDAVFRKYGTERAERLLADLHDFSDVALEELDRRTNGEE